MLVDFKGVELHVSLLKCQCDELHSLCGHSCTQLQTTNRTLLAIVRAPGPAARVEFVVHVSRCLHRKGCSPLFNGVPGSFTRGVSLRTNPFLGCALPRALPHPACASAACACRCCGTRAPLRLGTSGDLLAPPQNLRLWDALSLPSSSSSLSGSVREMPDTPWFRVKER